MQLPAEAPTTVLEAFARAAARHGGRPCLAVLPQSPATGAYVDTRKLKKRVAA